MTIKTDEVMLPLEITPIPTLFCREAYVEIFILFILLSIWL